MCQQSALRQKEAVLTEALTSHAAQLELWRAEAAEVAQAASKWKARAAAAAAQIAALEAAAADRAADATELGARAAAAESERNKLREVCCCVCARVSVCV